MSKNLCNPAGPRSKPWRLRIHRNENLMVLTQNANQPNPPMEEVINMTDTNLGVHGPYEDLAIAVVNLVTKIIDKQPPEVSVQLWKDYLADVTAWRNFFSGIK
jgi:hypothetical protein